MIDIETIQVNPKNPRLIKDAKFKKLVESVKAFPRMLELRPIIIDDDGIILGGNMRFQALKETGAKEIPESWVKRAADLTEDEKKEFIVKDNIGYGEWDFEILAAEWDPDALAEWGIDLPKLIDDEYTKKITAPTYEPKGEKPAVFELCETSKADELEREIMASSADEDTKAFLILAAKRHHVFNYEKIADFYAHSGKDVQALMEKSALVIIDFEKAIQYGYVKLSEEIEDIYSGDYDAE